MNTFKKFAPYKRRFASGQVGLQRCIGVFIGLFILTNTASAAIINTINGVQGSSGVAGCGTDPGFSITSSATIGSTFGDGAASCSTSASASAGGGYVGVESTFSMTPGASSVGQVRVQASSTINDLFITAADGYSASSLFGIYGSNITVTLRADVVGQVSSVIDTASVFSRGASSTLDGGVTIFSSFGRPTTTFMKQSSVTNGNSGITAGNDSIAQTLTVTSLINWSNAFSVTMYMGGIAGVSGYGDSFGTASVDAFNSLSFAKDGPVFVLPEGFTVFSEEANIIDNRWVDPRIPSVPVPPAAWLFGSGLLGLIGIARRKKV